MKRKGDTHYFRSLHYLLALACDHHPAADAKEMHFSTRWEHVTCKRCLERKPLTEEEARLLGFSKGNRE